MSYTPTTWANGDTITAAGLNKMEQGIAAAGDTVVLHVDNDTLELDKTYSEICSWLGAGKRVIAVIIYSNTIVTQILFFGAYQEEGENSYVVMGFNGENAIPGYTDSVDGYPVLDL